VLSTVTAAKGLNLTSEQSLLGSRVPGTVLLFSIVVILGAIPVLWVFAKILMEFFHAPVTWRTPVFLTALAVVAIMLFVFMVPTMTKAYRIGQDIRSRPH